MNETQLGLRTPAPNKPVMQHGLRHVVPGPSLAPRPPMDHRGNVIPW